MLEHELKEVELQYPQHSASMGPNDRFYEVMHAFHQTAQKRMSELNDKVREMRNKLRELASYLGDKIEPDEPEQVMTRINAFAVSFCKACRDNERAEHLKKKQAKAEADRAKRGASGSGTQRKVPVKSVTKTQDHYMNRIQGSLRRGEFDQMKALQMQMKNEIEGRMLQRRSSITGKQK